LPGARNHAKARFETRRYNRRFIFKRHLVPTPVFRFASVQDQSIRWFLRRNCSVTPVQLGWLYASLCAVSLGVATFFWFQGAVLVLPFAWLELARGGA
jgi:hypothetical protein